MAVRIESGSEPIPGYRLIERLGGGGFGEVWKAEAPGGLFKAIKFVYGDLQAADSDDGARAEQELKAMSRVKTVHHPYILSLERFDIVDGQLIIVMELADRTLWDRYKESRSQGLHGIPRDELIGYLQETAEALDLMNIQFQLQHLDIKPQNLFLVFNHIKVADFGLVKDLGSMGAATMTGGVTPVYAAPETFDGWLSRYSDQYSLAIVYQELLTGLRPFTGNTMRQLVLQHLQATPDVSSLPAAERPVILRALSKNPDDRFPSCVEMVAALKASRESVAPLPQAPKGPQTLSTPDSDFFKGVPSQAIADFDKTWNSRKGPAAAPPPPPEPSAAPAVLPLPVAPSRGAPIEQTPASQPSKHDMPIVAAGLRARPEKPAKPGSQSPSSHLSDEHSRGVIQPALVVGLGRQGVQTILQVRRILGQEFGHSDFVPHIRFLGIHTDADAVRDATISDSRSSLRPHECLLARLQRANQYFSKLRGNSKLPTDDWLNAKLLYRIQKENARAPLRPLGRLAFVSNRAVISQRIEAELQACASQDTLHEMSKHTDLGIRNHVPRVYVVASLAGSTGSGMFIDVAYLIRSHLRAMGFAASEIVGLFLLPQPGVEGIRSVAMAHSFAALSELNFFTQQEGMSARYDTVDAREAIHFSEHGPPFQRCVFLTMGEWRAPDDPAGISETVLKAGQFLYRDLATGLGKALDSARTQHLDRIRFGGAVGTLLQSTGYYRLGWPRREVESRVAEKFCIRLVERWKSKKSDHLIEEVQEWVGQQWDALELRPEDLIARHREKSKVLLESDPESMFQAILGPAAQAFASGPQNGSVGAIASAMDQFDKLLGIPEICKDASHRNSEPGIIEKALADASAKLADQCDQKLAEIVVGLIEAPRYRLAGAEEALRQFSHVAENSLKAQETLARELQERAAALYSRIRESTKRLDRSLDGGSPVTPATSQWFGRGKSSSVVLNELLELLRAYPKAQFQALLLQCLNRLYISLRGHLSDQLREVGFCRARLDELVGLLQVKRAAASNKPRRGEFEKELLPPGCKRIDDAVAKYDEQLNDDDFLAFDERVQTFVRRQYKALLNVCLGASGMVRAIAPVMIQEAETYLSQRFTPPDVIELMQSRNGAPGDPANLEEVVRGLYDEAAPDVLRIDEERQVALAVLPDSESGEKLADAVAEAVPQATVVHVDRCDEIVFVREQYLQGLGDLEQTGAVAQEAYRQRLSQDPTALHARDDIPEWVPRGAAVGAPV